MARLPRARLRDRAATSRSSTCSAARIAPSTAAELEYLAFTGTTDARAFVVHDETPATCYGPIGGNLHAPDEWVDLESVRATTLVLALAAAEWCG